jgi:hypothetical protein
MENMAGFVLVQKAKKIQQENRMEFARFCCGLCHHPIDPEQNGKQRRWRNLNHTGIRSHTQPATRNTQSAPNQTLFTMVRLSVSSCFSFRLLRILFFFSASCLICVIGEYRFVLLLECAGLGLESVVFFRLLERLRLISLPIHQLHSHSTNYTQLTTLN